MIGNNRNTRHKDDQSTYTTVASDIKVSTFLSCKCRQEIKREQCRPLSVVWHTVGNKKLSFNPHVKQFANYTKLHAWKSRHVACTTESQSISQATITLRCTHRRVAENMLGKEQIWLKKYHSCSRLQSYIVALK